ncbi:hypothetical protein AB0933_32160 [Streptomyces venezuelae]|uniref:hypothetical protein n=1 Tax=Streptomyces venezuelae TaxID=54571 RepID=UPI003453A80C
MAIRIKMPHRDQMFPSPRHEWSPALEMDPRTGETSLEWNPRGNPSENDLTFCLGGPGLIGGVRQMETLIEQIHASGLLDRIYAGLYSDTAPGGHRVIWKSTDDSWEAQAQLGQMIVDYTDSLIC